MQTPLWPSLQAVFDKKLSQTNLAITHMPAFIQAGAPLRVNDSFKYDNATHNLEEQQALIKEFILEVKKEWNEEYTVESLGFDAQMFSYVTFLDEVLVLLFIDMLFINLALLMVYAFLVVHLKSKFLATIGVSIIFMSFPLSAVIVQGFG